MGTRRWNKNQRVSETGWEISLLLVHSGQISKMLWNERPKRRRLSPYNIRCCCVRQCRIVVSFAKKNSKLEFCYIAENLNGPQSILCIQNFRIVNKMRAISIRKHSKHDRKIAVNMKNFFIIVRFFLSVSLFLLALVIFFFFLFFSTRHRRRHRIIYTCLLNLVIYVHAALTWEIFHFFRFIELPVH